MLRSLKEYFKSSNKSNENNYKSSNKAFFAASLRNFGSRIGQLFTRKKSEAAEEVQEVENRVEDVVEERAKKTDEALERTKSDAQKIAQEAGN